MTQSEFYQAEKTAYEQYRDNLGKIGKEISRIYITAAEEVSKKIKTLETKGKGDSLTAASLKKLESELRKQGAYISGEIENVIVNGINDTVSLTNQPHKDFLDDAIKISKTEKIDYKVIEDIYSRLNTTLIDLTYSRLWEDGYYFSERIYSEIPKDFQNVVKNIVNLGLAQNRDVLQIAKDLTYYSIHGKKKLMKRYGDLVRGSGKFRKRIPKNIDWRAMRIARSELYISLQDTAKYQGHCNPAVKWYDWNLTGGTGIHECICPDLAANSPYRELDIPNYPHPNCLCYITHRIIGRDEFVNDLIDWGRGAVVPHLDTWYQDVYLQAA